jgi:hypothetical protein
MTPARRSWLVILILIASFICFVVAWLESIGHVFHGSGYPEWIAGGFAFVAAALIAERVPAA